MKKEKILITGVAGFIGSKISQKLINNQNIELFGVDDLSNGISKNVPKNINFIKLDLSRLNKFHLLPKNIDKILHLAGQSSGEISFDNPVADLNKNVTSTLNLLKFYDQNQLKKFIYASSMSVYGDNKFTKFKELHDCSPLSCYGIGKLMSEKYIKILCKKTKYIIFRMFNVYGPGQDLSNLRQGMVSIYLAQAIKNKKILVKGNENRTRDFIYIDDVVNFWEKATFNKIKKNQILNLGTGVQTKVKDILKNIKSLLPETKIKILKKGTPGDQKRVCADINLLLKIFGNYKFLKLEKGLKIFAKNIINVD